ncbi:hypothetical protein [Bacillus sp. CHD6a]|nr:hypothetical protein [Bacillus sp. CHD6a]
MNNTNMENYFNNLTDTFTQKEELTNIRDYIQGEVEKRVEGSTE